MSDGEFSKIRCKRSRSSFYFKEERPFNYDQLTSVVDKLIEISPLLVLANPNMSDVGPVFKIAVHKQTFKDLQNMAHPDSESLLRMKMVDPTLLIVHTSQGQIEIEALP